MHAVLQKWDLQQGRLLRPPAWHLLQGVCPLPACLGWQHCLCLDGESMASPVQQACQIPLGGLLAQDALQF